MQQDDTYLFYKDLVEKIPNPEGVNSFEDFKDLLLKALKNGYDINYFPKGKYAELPDGFPLLYCALKNRAPAEVIALLIELGANTNIINQYGDNALSLAFAYQVSFEALKVIALKSDINSTNRFGYTFVGQLCEVYIKYGRRWGSGLDYGDLSELNFLLEHGADTEKDSSWKQKNYFEEPQLKRRLELQNYIAMWKESRQELQLTSVTAYDYEI